MKASHQKRASQHTDYTLPKQAMLLNLAPTFQVHPDVLVSNGNGVFCAGSQGSGKSVAMKLLLEQLAQIANVPMAIFDKEEDLVATADLFPRGFVATYHNCPTARDIYNDGLQVIYNLSTWPNMDIAGQMIARTVNQLMREAEQTAPQWRVPLICGMDEASYFLPQRRGDSLDEETYTHLRDAFEGVASRGRKRGVVPFLFTQKFSTIHKEVLSPGTYILMKQVTHTEQTRYLDYILPAGEFTYAKDAEKKSRIGTLRTGEAIVRLSTGEQRIVQFNHCQSEHVAHTPKTAAAHNRYARVDFNRNASYGSFIEDEEMENETNKTTDALPPLEKVPGQSVSGMVSPRKTAKQQIIELLLQDTSLRVVDLARLVGCDRTTASKVRSAFFR